MPRYAESSFPSLSALPHLVALGIPTEQIFAPSRFEARISFVAAARKLESSLLQHLNKLRSDRPLFRILEVLQNPARAIRRRAQQIREDELRLPARRRLSGRELFKHSTDSVVAEINRHLRSFRLFPELTLVDVHGDRYEYELKLTYNDLEKLTEFQFLEAMFLLKRMRKLDHLKQCPECHSWSWMRRRCDRYCPECEAKRTRKQ